MLRLYLSKRRQELGLSINKLAKKAGLETHHYYRIERGQIKTVSFIVLCHIALALDLPLFELYKNEVAYQNEREERWFDEAF